MLRTNTSAFTAKVNAYLVSCIEDENGNPFPNDAQAIAHAYSRFVREYNYRDNQRRYPNPQERIASWLSGLALQTAYTYADIIRISEQWHECKLTDKQADKVCQQWFSFLALRLLRLWQEAGFTMNRESANV